MRFPIIIGSKGRLDYPLKRWFKVPHILLVEPQEEAEYRKKNPGTEIVVMDKNNGGFGYMMNSQAKYALAQGERYYWFIDDDVLGLARREGKKLRPLREAAEQEEALGHVEEIAIKNKLAQVMISFAGHNWYFNDRIKTFVGAWCWILQDAKAIKAVGGYEEENLSEFHDWELSARLLTRGFNNACYYDYAFNHKMRGCAGGLTANPKKKLKAVKSAAYLNLKYPGITRLIYYVEHDQPEVRFNWNKLRKQVERQRPSTKLIQPIKKRAGG